MKNLLRKYNLPFILLFASLISAGCSPAKESSLSVYHWFDPDTITAGRFDMGKMWTFEYPPSDYFKQEYNFTPSQQWFDHVRLSALRFADYCSASFVSSDGLIMTNDHCARESLVGVQKEGENLSRDGFYAASIEEERSVPGLFVDQMVLIKDVTAEVQAEINRGINEAEKLMNEDLIVREIENRETEATGLEISVVPLYNGGKYSMYGYKRYTDVRLVFAPESQIGFFGGDQDNFTYPRYNLDCSFFRVYDDEGKPLESDDYFKWSTAGAAPGEAVFVVGNPGTTQRLNTISQLEYLRDFQYPRTLDLIDGLISIYTEMIRENPEREDELTVELLSYQNSQKAYNGMLQGLRDPVLMQRKIDFEKKFKKAVRSNPRLNEEYGNIWDDIDDAQAGLKEASNELFALSLNPLSTPEYFFIARDLLNMTDELKDADRRKSEEIDSTLNELFPEDFNYGYNNNLLEMKLKLWIKYLGRDHPLVKKFTNGLPAPQAVEYVLRNSEVTSPEKVKALIRKGPDAILKSDDPFIFFHYNAAEKQAAIQSKLSSLISKGDMAERQLGQAVFEVYGTQVPPDATFTLRISDGVVKGFPYNGTIAPPIVTFYGLYDRYYSFDKKSPWDLHERWTDPKDLQLEIPFNFVTTNDITGGSSGSPVINKNAEIVGVAFDGNIASLPGSFIFREEENRMVAVHSQGMLEALQKIYSADRLTEELLSGKSTADTSAVSAETYLGH